ncbi:MAG: glycosyltransferase [Candidatus Obscuribacterales bacterium]|nr:glycosyltransferase [Candidatus Obscuribacterales bacterium]
MPAEVSILLPIFNGERYLQQCIDSALSQSFEDIELIIVDDGSSDSSEAIVHRYGQQDKRIKFFRNHDNLGLFAAYNRCLENAQGEFIKPFAQDDLLSKNAVERMREVLSQDPTVSLVASACQIVDSHGQVVQTRNRFPNGRRVAGKDVVRYSLLSLSNWVGEPSTVMFRRKDCGRGFNNEYFHAGDLEMWLRLVDNGDLVLLDDSLVQFRMHDKSATSTNLAGFLFAVDAVRLGKEYRNLLADLGESEEHYQNRVAEIAAYQLDHLVRTQSLSVAEAISCARKGSRADAGSLRESKILDAFIELCFIGLRYATFSISECNRVRSESDSQCAHLNKRLEDLQGSNSWKLTAPLRSMMRSLRG